MVKIKEDLTGKVFGRLTVIEQVEDYIAPNGWRCARWSCQCDCGNIIEVRGHQLKSGNTKSCGCYNKDVLIKRNKYSELLFDEHGKYYIGYAINTNSKFYVDEDDLVKIQDYCWYEDLSTGISRIKAYDKDTKKNIRMHILIGCKGFDHIDRNELNNRRYNLRECTQQENCQNKGIQSNNTSGVIGVNWNTRQQKWIARITVNKKEIFLGYYKDKSQAIRVRLKAEKEYFKEFSPQQHLFNQYNI